MFLQPAIKRVRQIDAYDYEVTVEWERGIIRTLLNMEPATVVYRGSGTVWNEYPSGDSAGTIMDGWLSDRLKAWEWQQRKTST